MNPPFQTPPSPPVSEVNSDQQNSDPAREPGPDHVTIPSPKPEPSFLDAHTNDPYSDPQGANNWKRLKDLNSKIKQMEVDHKCQIKALAKENMKCQEKVAKFLAKNMALINEITVLRKEYAKYQHDNPPKEKMTPDQIEEARLLARLYAEYKRTQLRKVETDKDIEKPT